MAIDPNVANVLSPEDRDTLANLQFFARGVVEGLHAGRHRSSHKGASIQFKEHRQYVRGDEIRSIDWKLFGKTDRLYIKQYEDETNLRSMILLDQSGSMGYRSKQASLSKHQFAVRLAACLATLMIAQQDSVGIATFDDKLNTVLPIRSTARHLLSVLQVLAQSRPGAETSLAKVLGESVPQLKRRGVLILISDCFDSVDKLLSALSYFRHTGSEVVVMQVWDRDELEFPFRNRTEFKCLEQASRRQLVDPMAMRKAYLAQVEAFQKSLSAGCGKARIDLIQCVTDQDHSQLLSGYLASRGGRRNGARANSRSSEQNP
jgi:uncharacterized protein (DUF58 family)